MKSISKEILTFLNKFNFKDTFDLYSYYYNNGFYYLCVIDYVRNFRGNFKQYLNTKEDIELLKIHEELSEQEEYAEMDLALRSAKFFICQECGQLHIINKDSNELQEGETCKQCFKGVLIKEKLDKTTYADKVRTIIRYDNRKLYDTHLSKYVNLLDIIKMIQTKQVNSIVVKDYKSNKDVTKTILLSAIINGNIMPLDTNDLIEIIKGGTHASN